MDNLIKDTATLELFCWLEPGAELPGQPPVGTVGHTGHRRGEHAVGQLEAPQPQRRVRALLACEGGSGG